MSLVPSFPEDGAPLAKIKAAKTNTPTTVEPPVQRFMILIVIEWREFLRTWLIELVERWNLTPIYLNMTAGMATIYSVKSDTLDYCLNSSWLVSLLLQVSDGLSGRLTPRSGLERVSLGHLESSQVFGEYFKIKI